MHLAELDAAFPWGLVLATDEGSREPIPSWASPDEQVAAAGGAFVVRVMHEAEGTAHVHVWRDEAETNGKEVFSGSRSLPSGTLVVGDATGDQVVRVVFPPGEFHVRVFVDEPRPCVPG